MKIYQQKTPFALIVLIFIAFSCNNSKIVSEVSNGISQQIIFPLQHEHVHGPTIVELPNGDLLTAWFQGSGERWADDVRIMGARLQKGKSEWSEPFLMADTPDFPDINPAMFLDQEQRLWLTWYPVVANQWETSIPKYRISSDYEKAGPPNWEWQDIILVKPGDKTERGIQEQDRFVANVQNQFEQYESYLKQDLLPKLPQEEQAQMMALWEAYKQKLDSLAKGRNMVRRGRLKKGEIEEATELGYPLSRRIGWQTKNKSTIVGNRIILPLYSDGFDCSLFAITNDMGKTWEFSNPVIGGIGIQPAIAVAKDGSLIAYLRDNGPAPQRMQKTVSTDGGYTWSIAKDTEIPNPGAGFDIVTLATGEWLMVYNETEEGRHDLTAALSNDEGASWQWKKRIEFDDRGEKATASHYPAVVQGKNGLVHVVYSFHHKDRDGGPHKTIKYASFSVDWLKQP